MVWVRVGVEVCVGVLVGVGVGISNSNVIQPYIWDKSFVENAKFCTNVKLNGYVKSIL